MCYLLAAVFDINLNYTCHLSTSAFVHCNLSNVQDWLSLVQTRDITGCDKYSPIPAFFTGSKDISMYNVYEFRKRGITLENLWPFIIQIMLYTSTGQMGHA